MAKAFEGMPPSTVGCEAVEGLSERTVGLAQVEDCKRVAVGSDTVGPEGCSMTGGGRR
jgi:hypothetical protein